MTFEEGSWEPYVICVIRGRRRGGPPVEKLKTMTFRLRTTPARLIKRCRATPPDSGGELPFGCFATFVLKVAHSEFLRISERGDNRLRGNREAGAWQPRRLRLRPSWLSSFSRT